MYHYRQALELDPDDPIIYQNLLLSLHYAEQFDPEIVFNAHLAYERRYARPLIPSKSAHTNDRAPDRKLRVGYVSADLRRHSVAYFFEPVLSTHDRSEFHVTCYSD